MSRSLLRPGQYLLIAALFCALGGHWLVLQTVAWGGMIVDYARDASLTVAVEKTFDGQHPCAMCKTIARTRSTEKKRESQVVVKKMDIFYQTAAPFFAPASQCWQQASRDSSPTHRSQPPDLPPPRKA